MGVVADIWRSLTGGLRPVVHAHLARGPHEARSFAFLMLGSVLVCVAQWPRLARDTVLGGEDFDRQVAYALLVWLVIWPLVMYGLAGLAWTGSRLLGGRATPFGARLALFWSWLAAAPFALVSGAVAGFAGPGLAADLTGALWLGAFLLFWWRAQGEVARGSRGHVA